MKKAIILSAIIFTSYITMAQTADPVLHAKVIVVVDTTKLLIDSSEHGTCDFKDTKMVRSVSGSSSAGNGKAKMTERSRSENHHSSAVFRRKNSSL